MSGKFALLVFLALVCMVTNAIVSTTIHPMAAADLAVNQLQDSETSATAMRSYDYFMANFTLISWAVWGLFGLLLFRREVITSIKLALNN